MQPNRLKIISSNIQAGSITRAYSEYVTRSWSHIFHAGKQGNLDSLAQTYQSFDLVGLQECDDVSRPGRAPMIGATGLLESDIDSSSRSK